MRGEILYTYVEYEKMYSCRENTISFTLHPRPSQVQKCYVRGFGNDVMHLKSVAQQDRCIDLFYFSRSSSAFVICSQEISSTRTGSHNSTPLQTEKDIVEG